MTHYTDGRRFEYVTRDDLLRDGYEVLRSAGSKTKIDLVAFKPAQVLLVQCKLDGKLSPAERAVLLRVAGWLPGVGIPLLAYRPGIRGVPVAYACLTGPGPKQRVPWHADIVAEADLAAQVPGQTDLLDYIVGKLP